MTANLITAQVAVDCEIKMKNSKEYYLSLAAKMPDDSYEVFDEEKPKSINELKKHTLPSCGKEHLHTDEYPISLISNKISAIKEDGIPKNAILLHIEDDKNYEIGCQSVLIESKPFQFYMVHENCKIELSKNKAYKILLGPNGTINKYFRPLTGEPYLFSNLISPGKNNKYGTFLTEEESLTFANELIYKKINLLMEAITFNNIKKFNLLNVDKENSKEKEKSIFNFTNVDLTNHELYNKINLYDFSKEDNLIELEEDELEKEIKEKQKQSLIEKQKYEEEKLKIEIEIEKKKEYEIELESLRQEMLQKLADKKKAKLKEQINLNNLNYEEINKLENFLKDVKSDKLEEISKNEKQIKKSSLINDYKKDLQNTIVQSLQEGFDEVKNLDK